MKTKFILSFLLFISCTRNISAQTNWLWGRDGVNSFHGYSAGNSVTNDAAGNVYMTGVFYGSSIGFGSTTLHNGYPAQYNPDVFLAKYDASGNVLWAKCAGDSGIDEPSCVHTDVTGNVYVTGAFNSHDCIFGSTVLINSNNTGKAYESFLEKYDSNGNLLWAKKPYCFHDDFASSVTTDENGNIFVIGEFYGAITFDTITLTANYGNFDVYIVKYDPNGNAIWAKTVGGTGSDNGNWITIDPTGNIFVTGQYYSPAISFGSTTLTNANGEDLFIAKYDTNGNVIWAQGNRGKSQSIATDASGNLFLSGYFNGSSITFGSTTLLNAAGYDDVFLVKYNTNGNVLWAKSGTGNYQDEAYSVSTDSEGNSYLAGEFNQDTLTFGSISLIPPVGALDPVFIAKYDPNGNVLCASFLDDEQFQSVDGVSADAYGNAYVTGTFETNSFFVGSDTLTSPLQDAFVAKYNCNFDASVNDPISKETFSLYPNPSNGKFILENNSSSSKDDFLEIYNALGQKIISGKIVSQKTEIDLSNQANGIYFVNVQTENKSFTQRIIIQK